MMYSEKIVSLKIYEDGTTFEKEIDMNNYISKDKIRKLQKSLQKQITETRELFFERNTLSEIIYENEIKLLNELLEE